jgi:hypothetical protein
MPKLRREASSMARMMTRQERIEARHWLQVLSELARTVRNTMDPETGMPTVTDEAWVEQWESMTRDLDAFTARVIKDKSPVGGLGDRNA